MAVLSDPVDILLTHDRWATRHLIEASAGLNEEQFHRRFEIGCGSLHDTLVHVLGAMRRWTDVLTGQDDRPRMEAGSYALAELLQLLDELADGFVEAARARPFDEVVTAERNGQRYSFVRGAIVTHVVTHSMHHRAQCLNMLRHVGVESLPPNSVLQWTLAENAPASA